MNLEFAELRRDALLASGLDLHFIDQSLVFDTAKDQTVVFVGEAPGANEVKQGRPFCGAAGANLQKLVALSGLAKNDYYLANAFAFRPLSKSASNRAPTPKEIEFGALWLARELQAIQPKAIIALGDKAHNALCKISINSLVSAFKTLERHATLTIDLDFAKNVLIAKTFHPSPLVYNMPIKRNALENFFILLGKTFATK